MFSICGGFRTLYWFDSMNPFFRVLTSVFPVVLKIRPRTHVNGRHVPQACFYLFQLLIIIDLMVKITTNWQFNSIQLYHKKFFVWSIFFRHSKWIIVYLYLPLIQSIFIVCIAVHHDLSQCLQLQSLSFFTYCSTSS